MSKKVKIFAIVVVSLAAIIWVSSMMGGENATPVSMPSGPLSTSIGTMNMTPQPGATPGMNTKGSDFAALLSSIKSITIDDSIFSNPAYRALRDHPITLGTDIVGRTNPFAPVGTDEADLSSAPTVQTLQPGKVTSTSAEFSALVSFATTAPVIVVFQYGPTDQFGNVTPPQTLTKSGTSLATITTLSPNTKYYVQAVAVVGSTTTNGNTMTFTTTTPPAR